MHAQVCNLQHSNTSPTNVKRCVIIIGGHDGDPDDDQERQLTQSTCSQYGIIHDSTALPPTSGCCPETAAAGCGSSPSMVAYACKWVCSQVDEAQVLVRW